VALCHTQILEISFATDLFSFTEGKRTDMLFQSPPYSRYDLNFSLAGIPIRVHPLFWVIAILFGLSSGDPLQLVIWVVAVFVSVLIHELGHALAMRLYGQPSQIVLYAGGGLTIPEQVRWGGTLANVSFTPNQEIFVSLAGPGAGFLLAVIIVIGSVAAGGSILATTIFGFVPFPMIVLPVANQIASSIVMTFLWVNIFWGLINLLPVFPLDGGNVTRRVLLSADPWNGVRKSLWVSVIAGGIVAVLSLILMRSLYMAFLFGLLAFESYQALKGRVF
jgi:stage IV sporulation protein FB